MATDRDPLAMRIRWWIAARLHFTALVIQKLSDRIAPELEPW